MREYGITLLASYKNLRKTADGLERTVERKALASFQTGRFTALEAAEELCDMIAEKNLCRDLADRLDEILLSLSEGDRILLEYKYFRGKDAARYAEIDPASRTYYRRQNRAYERFLCGLLSRGMSQKWFNEHILPVDWLRELHRRVLLAERRRARIAEGRRKKASGGER